MERCQAEQKKLKVTYLTAAQAVEDFKKIASSLKVADFRLFGG